jgi:hypothetical protein
MELMGKLQHAGIIASTSANFSFCHPEDRGTSERVGANGAGRQSRPIATPSKEAAEDRLGKAIAGCKWIEFCGCASVNQRARALEYFAPAIATSPVITEVPGWELRPHLPYRKRDLLIKW